MKDCFKDESGAEGFFYDGAFYKKPEQFYDSQDISFAEAEYYQLLSKLEVNN